MTLSVMSDLHLETGDFEFNPEDADVAVLAGDIHEREKGLDWLLELGLSIPIVYVLGNHEFYKTSYPALLDKLRVKAKGTNVHVLDTDSVLIKGVRFHGATLWTDYRLFGNPVASGQACQAVMSDHKYIRRLPSHSRMRSVDLARIHHGHVSWLRKSISTSDARTNVVVTHHAPSPNSLDPEFRDEPFSAAYASELEGLIHELNPDLWIHGHCHASADYYVGQTRVICNPRGYAPDELNTNFRPDMKVAVSSRNSDDSGVP
ncbi:metallophosphoesterase [Alcanivorax sp. 1008]|nr:metallophosphoesterase [Alcanivorax sp. 1008]